MSTERTADTEPRHLTDDELERVTWDSSERPGGPAGGGSLGTRHGDLDGLPVVLTFRTDGRGSWSERPVAGRFDDDQP